MSFDAIGAAAIEAGEDESADSRSEDHTASPTNPLNRPEHWTDAKWNTWLSHVRTRVASAPKKRIPRPLYPEQVARRDIGKVIGKLGWFVYTYGFWPMAKELATGLRGDLNAVVYYLNELIDSGLAVHTQYHIPRTYSLTAAGWAALGLQPIEPWNVHPRSRIKRIAAQVAVNLRDMERAERLSKERNGNQ